MARVYLNPKTLDAPLFMGFNNRMSKAPTTKTRAWDLKPGDILEVLGLEVKAVTVDAPGRSGRMVHITHDFGVADVPINQFVVIRGTRETGLMD
jgi:hypothetical protein